MIMVVHQHIAMDLYGKTLGHFRQQIQKMLETALVSENLPTFDPAVDNMIPTSGQINSSRARHRSIIHFLPRWKQAKCCMLRRDPYLSLLDLLFDLVLPGIETRDRFWRSRPGFYMFTSKSNPRRFRQL